MVVPAAIPADRVEEILAHQFDDHFVWNHKRRDVWGHRSDKRKMHGPEFSTQTANRLASEVQDALFAARLVGALTTVHQIAARSSSPICVACFGDVHFNKLQLELIRAEADNNWRRHGFILCGVCYQVALAYVDFEPSSVRVQVTQTAPGGVYIAYD